MIQVNIFREFLYFLVRSINAVINTELWLQLYFVESIDFKDTIQPSLIFKVTP